MAKLSTEKRKQLPDSAFGIPEKRMYPLYKLDEKDNLVPDKAHIESAVKLFGHASDADKPELARNILKAAHEADMDTSGWDKVNAWAKKESPKKKESTRTTVTESTTSFDSVMAMTDLILEYNEILYDEFYDAVYSNDETFMEQFEEPDEVQEAVPGLWEDYLRRHMPDYDPNTHTVRTALPTTMFRDPETGELITRQEFEDRYGLDADIDSARVVVPEKRKQASWPKATSKEMNRRNAFLKRHKFDPKTRTIEIDEIDPSTGQKMRIPVGFGVGGKDDMGTSLTLLADAPDIPLSPAVGMQLGGTGLTQKAALTEPILGHETAHVHQRNALRILSRQFPHHRKIDDLLAAARQARTRGNERKAQQYIAAAGEYINAHITAIEAETAAIEKSINPERARFGNVSFLSGDTIDELHRQDPRYQRAVDNSQKYSRFLNSHDSMPDELHADDYGEELASKYTRGRRTGAAALEALRNSNYRKYRTEDLKRLRDEIDKGQHRTRIKRTSPSDRLSAEWNAISNHPKIKMLDHYDHMLRHPKAGDNIEAAKAKIAELNADPEVQELLAKRKAILKKEDELANDDSWYEPDREEVVPDPDSRYAGIDLSTISDDELIDRFAPTMRTNEKRVEIARQVAAEKAARDLANQQYRRKLSRDALQTQIDSGKLTPQQERKARQKIASIDAFERKVQSAANGTPITDTKKKKPSSAKKPEPKKAEPEKKPVETKKKEEPKKEPETKVAAVKQSEPEKKDTKKPTPTNSDKK